MAKGFQQWGFGRGDEGRSIKPAFRNLAEIDAPAGKGLSRGVQQVVQDEDLLREGDFSLAVMGLFYLLSQINSTGQLMIYFTYSLDYNIFNI
jgi:hypothetical protein